MEGCLGVGMDSGLDGALESGMDSGWVDDGDDADEFNIQPLTRKRIPCPEKWQQNMEKKKQSLGQ